MNDRANLGPNRRLIGAPQSRGRLATPALLLDLDAFEQNLATMSELCRGGLSLRPHAKTHKSVRIAKLQIASGAIGVCVASLREATVMVEAGIPGVHLTTPFVGGIKHEAFVSLIGRSDGLSAVVDNSRAAEELDDCVARGGKSLPVLVDVDLGSMYRTGVASADDAVSLARQIARSKSLNYAGIQYYSGIVQHIASITERERTYRTDLARLDDLLRRLRKEGLEPSVVSGGGTGTFHIDSRSGLFTENQAGSYIFMDVEYGSVQLLPQQPHPFKPALFVQATVISNNARGIATIDAGSKSLATDGPLPRVVSGAPTSAIYHNFGDEFGMIILDGDKVDMAAIRADSSLNAREQFDIFMRSLEHESERLEVGAKVELLVPHCDPTVNLHSYFHCLRGDKLVDIWPVDARDSL